MGLPILVVALAIVVGVSWRLFGSWFSPPAMFSAIWCAVHAWLALRSDAYFFNGRAAAYVLGCHLLFWLGALPFAFLHRRLRRDGPTSKARREQLSELIGPLEPAIALTSLIGLLGSLISWLTVARRFGSVMLFSEFAPYVRLELTTGELAFPLIGRLTQILNYPALSLAGFYVGAFRRRHAVAYLPWLGTLLAGVAGVGRAGILVGGTLYVSALLLAMLLVRGSVDRSAVARLVLVLVLMVAFFALIQALRWRGLYLRAIALQIERYVVGPFSAFSQYITNPSQQLYWGMSGFTAVRELLAVFGLPIEHGSPWIYTRVQTSPDGSGVNVYTFLRAIHEDFGLPGTVLFFYFLGALSAWLYVRIVAAGDAVSCLLLTGIYAYLQGGFVASSANYMGWLAAFLLPGLIVLWLVRRGGSLSPRPYQARRARPSGLSPLGEG